MSIKQRFEQRGSIHAGLGLGNDDRAGWKAHAIVAVSAESFFANQSVKSA